MEFENLINYENEGITSQIYYFNSYLNKKINVRFEKPFYGSIFFYFHHLKKCFWINLFKCSHDYFIFNELNKEFIIGFIGSESKFTINFEDYYEKKFLDFPFYHFFNQKKINQVSVSYSLKHLREKIREMYNLKYYYNKKKPLLIFGLYENQDKKIINEHSGDIYIIWGGSDILMNKKGFPFLNKKENIHHFCLSPIIKQKCLELGFTNIHDLFLTFCFGLKPYLYPLFQKRKGIYIYDGLTKNKQKNKIYNQSLIDKLIPKLNKYEIYRSSESEFTENIHEIYQKCFVAIRLTIHDGNANQIQECGLLGIPCISHQEMNHCLSWNNPDEIIHKINYIYQNNISILFKYPKPKILIISADKPGNGGGASSSYRLNNFLNKRGFNVSSLYLNHSEIKEPYFEDNIYNLNMNNNYNIKNIVSPDYDIVILRTAINSKSLEFLRDTFSKIYFFIPGIYKNECSEKTISFIHKMNVRQCQLIPSFANSRLSKIELTLLGLDCDVLEHNLLLLDNEMLTNKEIEWDCVFISSNLNRPIKNAELALNLLNFFGKRNWKTLVITNDEVNIEFQKKYKHVKFINGVNIEDMKNYYIKTRVVINTSHFDSMSNVLLEALNYGCHILCSSQNGLVDYIEDKEKFVVFDYDLENWKTILRKVLKQFDKNLDDRKKLFNNLLKKRWETEINLLKLLYV